MPANATTKSPAFSIYLIIGLIGLFAVLVGFSKTFFIPVSRGTFNAPATVHIHGAFAFAWVIFYIVQQYFIHKRNLRFHKSVGWVGAVIAVGVATTMLPAGMFQVQRELKAGLGETAISSFLGIVTAALIFVGLVGTGLYYRSKPEVHKALMLLATIFVLWPAWFRFRHFFPTVPRPDIWFGVVLSESFIVIACIVDWRRKRKLNRTLFYVGAFIILESILEVFMFDTPVWRTVSQSIYSTLIHGEDGFIP
jgi:hypothetical protein